MPAPELTRLRAMLLEGGVAPCYVERTILELKEHYTDIEIDALNGGCSASAAAARARALLGSDAAIAAAVCAQQDLLCWSRRWPRCARSLHALALCAVLPAVPVIYCAERGGSIARWSASIGLAVLMTGALLFAMQEVLV